jgi:hypothetical protein
MSKQFLNALLDMGTSIFSLNTFRLLCNAKQTSILSFLAKQQENHRLRKDEHRTEEILFYTPSCFPLSSGVNSQTILLLFLYSQNAIQSYFFATMKLIGFLEKFYRK